MTNPQSALLELADKRADTLRHMAQCVAQRLMNLDVEGRCGAAHDEKNSGRFTNRSC